MAPGLLIGSAPGHRQRRALAREGVTMVVDLRAEVTAEKGAWPTGVEFIHYPVEDGEAPEPSGLARLTSCIWERIGDGHRVFVHCQAGMGRSATVVCAVLMRMGWSLGEAYRALRAARPMVAPTDAQLALLLGLDRAPGREEVAPESSRARRARSVRERT